MKATWKEAVLAESGDTVVVEGNHYFPAEAINREHFRESDTHSHCPWKGDASYYDVVVGDEINKDAAWYYPEPKEAAASIWFYDRTRSHKRRWCSMATCGNRYKAARFRERRGGSGA